MHKRDCAKLNQWFERLESPDLRALTLELDEFARNRAPSRAERVRHDRLRFELVRRNKPLDEEIDRRWVRYGLNPLDEEYLRQQDIGFLQGAIPDFDRRVEDAKAEGIARDDIYFIELCKMRRDLRRKLRRLLSRPPSKTSS